MNLWPKTVYMPSYTNGRDNNNTDLGGSPGPEFSDLGGAFCFELSDPVGSPGPELSDIYDCIFDLQDHYI